MKVKEATRPTSATTRLALTFGSLVLLIVELIRNVRMVVHELVGRPRRDACILCGIRLPRFSKSRESITARQRGPMKRSTSSLHRRFLQ